MNKCSDHKETLLLDVHGELNDEERGLWKKHLADCTDCQNEKKRLLSLIKNAKDTTASPSLSSAEEQFLSGSIQRRLRMDKPDAGFNGVKWWLAPAMAACMILLFTGWFSLKDFKSSDNVAINGLEEQIMVNNGDLLENMELLQEMEALEKLVRLLDDSQGVLKMNERESKVSYVKVRV